MPLLRAAAPLLSLLATLALPPALAADAVDPATLYEVSTEGSTTRLKAGEQGQFVLTIRSKGGAYVSDEAPLRLELTGTQLTPQRDRLTLKDSVAPRPAGQKSVAPRFEVPFGAATAGRGTLDAKLTFFICTENLCARQQRTFTVPVEVL